MNAEEVLDWFAEEIVSGIADSITSATDRSTAAKVEVFHFLLFDVIYPPLYCRYSPNFLRYFTEFVRFAS